jgi:hypothetical protein
LSRAPGRWAACVWPICLALALGACAATSTSNSTATSTSTAQRPPAHRGGGGGESAPVQDTFTGFISSATGAYAGRRGQFRVYLHPRGSGLTRDVRAVFVSQCAASSQDCTGLDGTVLGTLRGKVGRVPDVGRDYTLRATGRVNPLGHITVRGAVDGTGFISSGHEAMSLTLKGSSGSVTVEAHSAVVKGFTSP